MTRRYLSALAGALLFGGVAAGAPAPAVQLRAVSVAGQPGAPVQRGADPVDPGRAFDAHLGDGVFQFRIRGCDTCGVSVTIVVAFGELWRLISS